MAHTSSHVPPDPRRAAGVLLHPTSLPGRYGVGDLGDEVLIFLDWAAAAGMRVWQVLPLNPPGYGYSPYGCLSSFAGNPMLVSPQRLLYDGLLDLGDVADVPHFTSDHVELERVDAFKNDLLRTSWKRFGEHATEPLRLALEAFVQSEEQRDWLEDYSLFMALKVRTAGRPWWLWDEKVAARDAEALTAARRENAEEIAFWNYVQFLYFRQWAVVREAAQARGISIMGDVPIYVARDSADVWAARDLFQIDEHNEPTVVAGVPPDYFSETGQRWGNPLYRWDRMRESGYRWWISRIRASLRFADVIRLDHFRGFASYWEIPAAEPTAIHGRWMPGPGLALFAAIRNALGSLPLVAEDLGFITQDVHDLRHAAGLPGMKILQFGFAQDDSPHLPHRYADRCIAYTGTHDNDTARGWFEHASREERENALAYLGCVDERDVARGLIRAVYTSVAETAVVPVQDILGLGSDARMNRPGEEDNNWRWRVGPGALTDDIARELKRLARITGRA